MAIIDFSDYDLDNAEELKALHEGWQGQIRILSAETRINKNGQPFIIVRFEPLNEPTAKDFTVLFNLTHSSLTPKQNTSNRWNLKLFMQCFGLDASRAYDPERDWIGAEGYVILGTKDNGDQYGIQNTINKFIAPA